MSANDHANGPDSDDLAPVVDDAEWPDARPLASPAKVQMRARALPSRCWWRASAWCMEDGELFARRDARARH